MITLLLDRGGVPINDINNLSRRELREDGCDVTGIAGQTGMQHLVDRRWDAARNGRHLVLHFFQRE